MVGFDKRGCNRRVMWRVYGDAFILEELRKWLGKETFKVTE